MHQPDRLRYVPQPNTRPSTIAVDFLHHALSAHRSHGSLAHKHSGVAFFRAASLRRKNPISWSASAHARLMMATLAHAYTNPTAFDAPQFQSGAVSVGQIHRSHLSDAKRRRPPKVIAGFRAWPFAKTIPAHARYWPSAPNSESIVQRASRRLKSNATVIAQIRQNPHAASTAKPVPITAPPCPPRFAPRRISNRPWSRASAQSCPTPTPRPSTAATRCK